MPTRAKPLTPCEQELVDARRILDQHTRELTIEKIKDRMAAFAAQWPALCRAYRETETGVKLRAASCSNNDGDLSPSTGLIYQGKPYCAGCRSTKWTAYGRRVGIYP